MQTGEPYLVFIDTANKAMPKWLSEKGLKINGSNLCTEIFLPTNDKRTAVCCLSSLNLEYYDDWKNDKQFILDVMEMLDNVLQYFIDKAPSTIARAKYSAMMERSIGVGTLGFHALLQKKGVAIDGVMAKSYNNLRFDSQVIEWVLRNCEYWHDLSGLEIAAKIAEKAADVIHDANYDVFPEYRESDLSLRQLDLFKIHHFDNKNRRVSLKRLEFEMDLENIEEMPIAHDMTGMTEEDISTITGYCLNDVWATYQFYRVTIGDTDHPLYKGDNKIELRQDIEEEFGIPSPSALAITVPVNVRLSCFIRLLLYYWFPLGYCFCRRCSLVVQFWRPCIHRFC